MPEIIKVTPDNFAELLPQLVALLQDAVDSGASLGFLLPLDRAEAEAYWQAVRQELENGSKLMLAALSAEGRVAGSVQLALATKPNAPHRAEVQKLCVHRADRRQGLGEALLRALEEIARPAGRRLLVLDTRQGDPAEQLYGKIGYTQAGIIPEYVINEKGDYEATVVYYKIL